LPRTPSNAVLARQNESSTNDEVIVSPGTERLMAVFARTVASSKKAPQAVGAGFTPARSGNNRSKRAGMNPRTLDLESTPRLVKSTEDSVSVFMKSFTWADSHFHCEPRTHAESPFSDFRPWFRNPTCAARTLGILCNLSARPHRNATDSPIPMSDHLNTVPRLAVRADATAHHPICGLATAGSV
jgi:hypothetical protein